MVILGIRSRYVLGKRCTFVYHNPSPCEIVYYQGLLINPRSDKPLKESVHDVSFVCFDDLDSAKQVLRYSRPLGSYVLVLEPISYYYDSDIKKHLVCFERFDGFLPQGDRKLLARLKALNLECPGNPDDFVQNKIQLLINTLWHMHLGEVGVSSSFLHLPVGYVWCGETLKIFMIDACKQNHTDVEWKKIAARDVQRLGIGLDQHILKTSVAWPEKDSFMRSFCIRLQEENNRLPMILDHPFLQNSISEMVWIFSDVNHALRSSNHGRFNLTKFMAALNNSKQLKSEFMPNGVWTRPEMSPKFELFLRGEPQGNSIKYDTTDMGDLLRYLRNLYENGHQKGMSMDFMFKEIQKYWPHLLDRFHEKIAGFSTRSLNETYYF